MKTPARNSGPALKSVLRYCKPFAVMPRKYKKIKRDTFKKEVMIREDLSTPSIEYPLVCLTASFVQELIRTLENEKFGVTISDILSDVNEWMCSQDEKIDDIMLDYEEDEDD